MGWGAARAVISSGACLHAPTSWAPFTAPADTAASSGAAQSVAAHDIVHHGTAAASTSSSCAPPGWCLRLFLPLRATVPCRIVMQQYCCMHLWAARLRSSRLPGKGHDGRVCVRPFCLMHVVMVLCWSVPCWSVLCCAAAGRVGGPPADDAAGCAAAAHVRAPAARAAAQARAHRWVDG